MKSNYFHIINDVFTPPLAYSLKTAPFLLCSAKVLTKYPKCTHKIEKEDACPLLKARNPDILLQKSAVSCGDCGRTRVSMTAHNETAWAALRELSYCFRKALMIWLKKVKQSQDFFIPWIIRKELWSVSITILIIRTKWRGYGSICENGVSSLREESGKRSTRMILEQDSVC